MMPNLFYCSPFLTYNPFMQACNQMLEAQAKMLGSLLANPAMFPLAFELPMENFAIKVEICSMGHQGESVRNIEGEVLDKKRNK